MMPAFFLVDMLPPNLDCALAGIAAANNTTKLKVTAQSFLLIAMISLFLPCPVLCGQAPLPLIKGNRRAAIYS
jgi:hypothetical protein